uniref:Uncharacterized protein n=1 Tax=Fusarium oxysporum (strain Fo5176) TaxID=660025 RepID=A0A0D2XY19_FUSOF
MTNAQCYNCIYANGAPSCDACPSAIPNGCGGCIGGCPAAEGGTSSSYEVDLVRFRVISAIRFQRRFGFVEQRKDVQSMVSGINCSLEPAAMIAQVPAINPWMIGNNYVTKFLARQPFVRVPDPGRTVVKVEHKTALCQKAEFP